jgi:hypothetical protein
LDNLEKDGIAMYCKISGREERAEVKLKRKDLLENKRKWRYLAHIQYKMKKVHKKYGGKWWEDTGRRSGFWEIRICEAVHTL